MKDKLHGLCAIHVFLALSLAANGAAAQGASAIALGSPVSGTISAAAEIDWYTVTTDVVGDLTVTQTAWPPYIETRIAIFGPNSQTLAQSNPATAAAPGTYYIKVWSAVDGVSTDVYTFTATLAKAGTGNDIDGGKNSASGAVAIALETAVSDTIAPSKETAGIQDVDWFTVTTDVVGDLAVTQTAWPPYIDTKIAIFGPNDATVAQGNPVTAAAPGIYYIKVWSAADGSSIAPYTFSASLTKAITGNDIDSGKDSPSGAIPIVLDTPVSDTIAPSAITAGKQDVDWFTITTDVVGDLAVTQTAWPPYIDTKIAIFGPNSDTLAQGNPVAAAAPGTYYIKVWSAAAGSSIAPYTFSASLTKAITGNDIDSGKNSPSGAVPIVLGALVSDTIAPSKETAGKQDVDWFTLTTTATGDLTVTQSVWPPYIATSIAIFGPDSETLAQNNPVVAPVPGKYYIKVWSANDGSSIAPYTFTVTQKGVDAGTVLSLPDAGTADAARDSAGADSGRADAGTADAAPDSAGANSARPDAGFTDGAASKDGAAFPSVDGAPLPGATADAAAAGPDASSRSSGGTCTYTTGDQASGCGCAGLALLGLALALARRRRAPRV